MTVSMLVVMAMILSSTNEGLQCSTEDGQIPVFLVHSSDTMSLDYQRNIATMTLSVEGVMSRIAPALDEIPAGAKGLVFFDFVDADRGLQATGAVTLETMPSRVELLGYTLMIKREDLCSFSLEVLRRDKDSARWRVRMLPGDVSSYVEKNYADHARFTVRYLGMYKAKDPRSSGSSSERD